MNLEEDLDLDAALSSIDSETIVSVEEIDADANEIRELLRVDPEFFIEFFLHDQLDMEVPQFHKDIWGLLTNTEKERVLLAIPRDHAKTTLAKLVVIWYWLFTSHRFCVYLSSTNAIAKGAAKDIVGFLKSPNFVRVFGKVGIIKESENESLWIYDLPLLTGGTKRIILRAIGQGQQMRGINIDNQRPDISVIDDVEDNDVVESKSQQKKLDNWMFGSFLKALARRKKTLWLGNMLSKTSLLARLSRSPRWNPVVFGSLVKNREGVLVPLWPDKWLPEEIRGTPIAPDEMCRLGVQYLKEDLKEYRNIGQLETWMCEMMNMPGHGENGFSLEQINYAVAPTPDMIRCAWITIDPAFGLNSENDQTCISVHVVPIHGLPMTVCEAHGRWDEFTMFSEALKLAQYWNAYVWGIEAVAAQKVLITLFSVLLAQRQMMNHVEMIPLLAGRGDPKVSRIRAFVSLMANGEWAIPEYDIDITKQILEYDMRKKEQEDDIIDSCAYGPVMMEQYLPVIMAAAAGKDWSNDSVLLLGTEVAGV